MSELKNCPFCNSKAYFTEAYEGVTVGCENEDCWCYDGAGWSFDKRREAIALWNKRSTHYIVVFDPVKTDDFEMSVKVEDTPKEKTFQEWLKEFKDVFTQSNLLIRETPIKWDKREKMAQNKDGEWIKWILNEDNPYKDLLAPNEMTTAYVAVDHFIVEGEGWYELDENGWAVFKFRYAAGDGYNEMFANWHISEMKAVQEHNKKVDAKAEKVRQEIRRLHHHLTLIEGKRIHCGVSRLVDIHMDFDKKGQDEELD